MNREDVIDALSKPFPKQAIKQNQGRDYVTGTTVIYRLNAATDYDWEFEITGHELVGGADSQGNKPAQVVYGRMRIPIISSGWRADMGTQALENSKDDHEAYKGAATDCLKRCARQFGVGLHLWGEDIEAGELPVRRAEPQRQQQPTQTTRNETQQGGGPPMTDKQCGFIISLAKQAGMVVDGGHHDDAALDAESFRITGKKFKDLSVGDAKVMIEAFQNGGVNTSDSEASAHPTVQGAINNREANYIAQMESALNKAELDKIGSEIAVSGIKSDALRSAYAKNLSRVTGREVRA